MGNDSIWKPMKYFLGEWVGEGEGGSGKGAYERSYNYILKNKFIEIKNKATYPATDKKQNGELHEDIGYLSYDSSKKKFMFRQFFIEGFVNEYAFESISSDGKTIVFVTESTENIPADYKAKETYRIINEMNLKKFLNLQNQERNLRFMQQ